MHNFVCGVERRFQGLFGIRRLRMIRLQLSLALFAVIGSTAFLNGCGGGNNKPSSGTAWSISISQTGSFAPNGVAQYSIAISNSGNAATGGAVAVTDSLPGLVTASSIF